MSLSLRRRKFLFFPLIIPEFRNQNDSEDLSEIIEANNKRLKQEALPLTDMKIKAETQLLT